MIATAALPIDAANPVNYIRGHLKALAWSQDQCAQMNKLDRSGWHAGSYEALTLTYGITRPGAKRPKGMRKGRYKLCFQNTFRHVMADHQTAWVLGEAHPHRYTYVEGWAIHAETKQVPVSGFSAHHAWLLDNETGCFVDTTWEWSPNHVYLGIPIQPRWFTRSMARSRVYGIFYNDLTILTDPVADWLAPTQETTR